MTDFPPPEADEELVPVSGILDVVDRHGFVRASGYLPTRDDAYVSAAQIARHGLRPGDEITGAARRGGRRDKHNPLARLDSVNGDDPRHARGRPEFYKLTPLHPEQRLRLETEPQALTTRVIDLIMPIGKGQRALIVAPPKAGKTMVLHAIATAVSRNHPGCHLMVVLVDERPEEVTDMRRTVRGEVVASTSDRLPGEHTAVAELAIERAKRLVEQGRDVVVLLDSLTRLGRAYNLAAKTSGKVLSGGIDAAALHPPKRLLTAGRCVEGGGSLTILATALVETGSLGDTLLFEELKGTGNAELKLDRKAAERRVYPAIDIAQSGTRREDLLLTPAELAVVSRLRRALHAADAQHALDQLLDRLRRTRSNAEFLGRVAAATGRSAAATPLAA